MSDDTHPEHDSLHGRLDDIDGKLQAIEKQTTATNGRTGRLEDQMLRVRQTMWGAERDGLGSDGGLVGWVRQTRRDIRLLGAAVVFVMPVVMLVLDRTVL